MLFLSHPADILQLDARKNDLGGVERVVTPIPLKPLSIPLPYAIDSDQTAHNNHSSILSS